MSNNNFCFEERLGKEITNKDKVMNRIEPIIAVITPFYNSKDLIKSVANCLINQTFPYWEWIVVDDGSEDKESLKILESLNQIEELKGKLTIYHKKNEGLAATRDFGAKKISKSVKYLCFYDDDDLITPEYLECAYWTLETNKDASWAYTDVVNFGEMKFIWRKWFDTKREKEENLLVAIGIIRKEAYFEVNGYELREKSVYEDWNFWLKLIAKGHYPVRMNFLGFWYRKKAANVSELSKATQNKQRALEIINATAKTIKKEVKAIQYPRDDYNWEKIEDKIDSIVLPKLEDNHKIKILMMIPWMAMGGADRFNLDFLEGLDKNKFEVIIITTQPNENEWRQKFEENAKAIYELPTFINKEYWLAFINYIIQKNNINIIFNTNSLYGYSILPYLKAKYNNIPIVDYIHMEEWYFRNGGFSRESSACASVIDKTYLCNKNSEKILAEYFHRNPEELGTVYIGVDEKKFDPDKYNKEEILQKYDLTEKVKDKKTIGFICRIDLQKRPYLLIEIIKKLKSKRDDFVVLVAGNGPMLSRIRKKAKSYNIDKDIVFLGPVKNTAEFYAMCDITLNCSIKEGLALTSYESLAMGVPNVSADVGGQKELIDEHTGVIVPCLQREKDVHIFQYSEEEIKSYVDGVEKVFADINTYKQNCRKRVLEGFTIDLMKKNMSRIMEEIHQRPNEQKIQNGKDLANNIEMTKEMITKELIVDREEYQWLCNQCNKQYGFAADTDAISIKSQIKDNLWRHKTYRFLIKILQKTGIIKLIKRIMGQY